jgi:preprotein translocase subunit SecD
MSPPQSRAQAKRQQGLIISLFLVVVIAVGSLGATVAAKWSPRLGLDLAGGLSVIYTPVHKTTQANLNETVTVLSNRVNGLGVSGAQVSTQGGNIAVSVPGVKNGQALLQTIGQTAQLYFRPVLCGAPVFAGTKTKGAKPVTAALPTCSAASATTKTALAVTQSSTATAGYTSQTPNPDESFASYPSTPAALDDPLKTVLLPEIPNAGSYDRYVLGPSQLNGHSIGSAVAQQDQTGNWVVNYTLTGTGSGKWDTVASNNFHQLLAIELDGVVQSAPLIQPGQATFSSFGGKGEISGSLTQTQAQSLALAMQFGSLPVRLKQQTVTTVSPTLGKSSLKAGLFAGLAGLFLVLIYVIVYYRLLGLVVVSGLAVTAALLWSIISALGHTALAPSFDLAGVTGIIVSIGITVDSYIVYFERLKDETRSGRTVRTSVDRGFKSAWRTVLAADLVSLAAAVVLYLVAVGDVRGFAFFLGLSTLMDIFITYFYTRPLVIILGRNERLTEAKMIGISTGLAVKAGANA